MTCSLFITVHYLFTVNHLLECYTGSQGLVPVCSHSGLHRRLCMIIRKQTMCFYPPEQHRPK
jgi:hypothetical protein